MLLSIFNKKKIKKKNALIIGAGEGCRIFLSKKKELDTVVGILDDDAKKLNQRIFGIKVLGSLDSCSEWVKELKVSQIFICIEKISSTKLKHLIDSLDLKQVKVRIIPRSEEYLTDNNLYFSPRFIKAEDLLGRSEVQFNNDLAEKHISGKVVLVTGAGGSIGLEICKQLLRFKIKKLICLTRSEFTLYQLQEKLKSSNIDYYLGDIRDIFRLKEIFAESQPDYVLHAAAHKHVSYMEFNEKEAIKK